LSQYYGWGIGTSAGIAALSCCGLAVFGSGLVIARLLFGMSGALLGTAAWLGTSAGMRLRPEVEVAVVRNKRAARYLLAGLGIGIVAAVMTFLFG
jgi:hypothetical protein